MVKTPGRSMELLLAPAADAGSLPQRTTPVPARPSTATPKTTTVTAATTTATPTAETLATRAEMQAPSEATPGTAAAAAERASTETPAAPVKPKPKRGCPAKTDTELWTTSSTETLFTVRYVTVKEEFTRARNHVQVGAAWILVVTLVNKAEDTEYTVKQCKDKIKWLKKKWGMYREERNATGNVPMAAPPPCLDLMVEHWAPNPGMQNMSLCDGTTEHDDSDVDGGTLNDDDTAISGSTRNKRKKTNGECVEEGLRALADGVRAVGEAMKEKAAATAAAAPATPSDPILAQHVIASLARQEDALKQQTAAIHELICTLKGEN
ncbi:hypothetical protein PF005_g28178 [Phytophthora fragariae]|uniref:Myb/SANT-like domain-containing protein n=2 Tax=Phytophthora fragariae TaxID=53985 RepID=A0A6A4BIB3_9STRA|nr:hypothetical protein PF003_g37421 [Phytophthora fragariae]KAE8936161.1 hypothetical protein PF009_g13899 [Phytophthora fragariae]KAE8968174.1 hypothetical protein PF011_g27277 [Phytophthora fragariae]KAE9078154.1 hypothetical protein PF006_g27772 [Phytophthora fragariae]KAE9168921.1 hypothetical protein PF005_g28178 [Phytophthora fragariae]